MPDDLEPCECEMPGYFHSTVPGVIARVENGRLVVGATVERCDACQRYPTDEAAKQELVRRGMYIPWYRRWICRILSLK